MVLPTLVNKCFVVNHAENVFVVDRGQLTFYSHQDQSKWNELYSGYIEWCILLKKHFAKINVNERNVFFNMRHKLLVSLRTEERPIHSGK